MEEENKDLKEKLEEANSFKEIKDVAVGEAKEKIRSIKPIKKIKIVGIAILAICCLVVAMQFFGPKVKHTNSISSTVEKIELIDELGSCIFPYRGMTEIKNAKGKTETYMTYEGTVTIGVKHFADTSIKVDEKNKQIIITLPPIEKIDANVTSSSIETLDETKIELPERKRIAEGDLLEKFNQKNESNNYMYECAENNIKNTLETLLNPIISSGKDKYTIVYSEQKGE